MGIHAPDDQRTLESERSEVEMDEPGQMGIHAPDDLMTSESERSEMEMDASDIGVTVESETSLGEVE